MFNYITISVVFIFFFGLCLNLFISLSNRNRLKKFMLGQKGLSLENSLEKIIDELKDLENKKDNLLANQKELFSKIESLVLEPVCIRFNPFNDSGGNQCFAIALLSSNGNGVVISSLYAQAKTSVFAKPVINFVSKYDLTKEEKEVILITKEGLKNENK